MRGLFITATDTGTGKTALTAGIAGLLRRGGLDVGVAKPVATGAHRREGHLVSLDAQFLKSVSGVSDTREDICPLVFETPASPLVAAEHEGKTVDLVRLRAGLSALAARHDFLLVEGIGGWRVPIAPGFTVRELALELALPVLVIARAGLGTINHTTLTVEAIRSTGLTISGVILNCVAFTPEDITTATNACQIRDLTGVDVLGTVPFDPQLSVDEGRPGNILRCIEDHVNMEPIVRASTSGRIGKWTTS